MSKIYINDYVGYCSPYEFSQSLGNLKIHIESLIKIHGDDATLEWDPDYREPYEECTSPRYDLCKYRLETDSELIARENRENQNQVDVESAERAMLALLQNKFKVK